MAISEFEKKMLDHRVFRATGSVLDQGEPKETLYELTVQGEGEAMSAWLECTGRDTFWEDTESYHRGLGLSWKFRGEAEFREFLDFMCQVKKGWG